MCVGKARAAKANPERRACTQPSACDVKCVLCHHAGIAARFAIIICVYIGCWALMWGLRWRQWTRRMTTAEVRPADNTTANARICALTRSRDAHYAVQVEIVTGREVVKQGTPLLRNRLRPGEVLLWVGCSGITKSREQVQHESVCTQVTCGITVVMFMWMAMMLIPFTCTWGCAQRRAALNAVVRG